MKYENMIEGKFIERSNRFIAKVLIQGKEETVHVKNTGRCKELLLPGASVFLERSSNPNRKTQYDLISVWKEPLGFVNIDSQIPNHLVAEWLKSKNTPFKDLTCIQPEYTFGKSRIDFYLEQENKKILMEVKGCTLEINGQGYFPDAPTLRGIKHLQELSAASKAGYDSYLAFVIAMNHVETVLPNMETHPEFGEALQEAIHSGVHVLYLPCTVTQNEIYIHSYSFLNT